MNTIIKLIATMLLAGLLPGQYLFAQIDNISPPNGFLITNPIGVTFQWKPLALPSLTHDYHYTLSLYRLGPGQTEAVAIANNTPLLEANTINKTEYPYSFSYDYAGKGKLVWRVCGFRKPKKIKGPFKPIEVCGKPSIINVNMKLPTPPATNCQNSGFEEGDLSEWTFATGTWGNVTTPGIVVGRHRLMAAGGVDPNVPLIPVTPTNGGSFSLRLGNQGSGSFSESATFSLIVDPSNQYFNYNFAVILESPINHVGVEAYFHVEAYEMISGNEVLIDEVIEIGDVNNTQFFQNFNGIAYRNWICNQFDLSNHIGDEVFIRFTTADCNWGPGTGTHFGYAYIDMLCSEEWANTPVPDIQMDDVFCLGQTILADFSQTVLTNDHTIVVLDLTTGTGAEANSDGLPGSNFDITDFYTQNGFSWVCGRTYQVNLIARNNCANDVATTHVFRIADCPQPNVSPIETFCEDDLAAGISLGGTAVPGATYSWTPSAMVDDPTSANPKITSMGNSSSQAFQVVMTSADGCISTELLMINIIETPSISIAVTDDHCFHYLTSTVTNNTGISEVVTWTNQLTGATYTGATLDISKEDASATYSATVSLSSGGQTCTSVVSNSIPLTQNLYYYRTFLQSDLSIPTGFTPDGNGLNDIWSIVDANGPAIGVAPAYNATDAIVRVYNDWGTLLYEQVMSAPPGGFSQGSLAGWDGTYNGVTQPLSSYPFYVQLKNCNNEWTEPSNDMWKGNVTSIP